MSIFRKKEVGMECRQCEETLGGTGCIKIGVCGKNAEVAASQDRLIRSLIALSEAAESGKVAEGKLADIDTRIVTGLFKTLTNTNFDENIITKDATDNEALAKSAGVDAKKLPIGIHFDRNADLASLKELLLYGTKGLAAYYHHAVVLGYGDATVTAFIRKALSSLVKDLSADELVALNLECGTVGATAMALLDKANTTTYGIPEITSVKTGVGKNPGILITGHDLKDLEQLLEQTKGTGIDVYTHGELLPANAYPKLKTYGNLVGNYGNAWYKQKDEFEAFNGPIIATTNCVLIPKESYRPRLFTTGASGIPGATHIPADKDGNKDFSKVIALARSSAAPGQIDDTNLTIGFGHDTVLSLADKIIEAVKAGAIKRFVVMAGCDGRQNDRTYYADFANALPKDTVILTAGCAKYRYNKLDLGDIGGIPRVIDAGQCNDCYSLVVIASALAEAFGVGINELPLSFNIAWYEQKACLVLLTLLSLGVKDIMLGPRLPAFITPGILDVLVKTFDIKPNSDVVSDLKILHIE
ncbi:MAG: hydroxylamine reductase [Candidatus Methanoplasma sp.]|jgi:hydroxylamine reductase|nr:hydroxylamine reductase [Candidatus Methanoplasma sp.]